MFFSAPLRIRALFLAKNCWYYAVVGEVESATWEWIEVHCFKVFIVVLWQTVAESCYSKASVCPSRADHLIVARDSSKLQIWNEKKPKQPKCISYLQLGLPDRRAINPNQVLVGHETTNLWLSENQHAIGGTRNQDGVHPIPLFAALRGCKGITVDWTKNDWISLKGVEVLFQTFPSSASCSLYISTCCCQSWGHCPCSASLEFPFPESLWLFQDCVEVECENRLLLSRDLEALAKRSISTYSSPHWFSRFPRFLAYEYLSCFDNA